MASNDQKHETFQFIVSKFSKYSENTDISLQEVNLSKNYEFVSILRNDGCLVCLHAITGKRSPNLRSVQRWKREKQSVRAERSHMDQSWIFSDLDSKSMCHCHCDGPSPPTHTAVVGEGVVFIITALLRHVRGGVNFGGCPEEENRAPKLLSSLISCAWNT